MIFISPVYSRRSSAQTLGSDFVQELASTSEILLLMFDSLLIVDEVETGRKFNFQSNRSISLEDCTRSLNPCIPPTVAECLWQVAFVVKTSQLTVFDR